MAVCEKARRLLLLWCGKMREMSDDGPLLARGAAARWRRRCMCCWRFGDVAEGFVSAVERNQAAERAKRMATRERRKDGLRERVLEDVVAGRRGWGFLFFFVMGEVAGCAAACETVSGEIVTIGTTAISACRAWRAWACVWWCESKLEKHREQSSASRVIPS